VAGEKVHSNTVVVLEVQITMKILSVIGTRPEAVKMAPIVAKLSRQTEIDSRVMVTGQHREMLDQVLDLFDIKADYDLNVMQPSQSPLDVMSIILAKMQPILSEFSPDWLLVQGDTTSVLAATLAGNYSGCRIGHVEAGLRSYNRANPFPEELNRVLVDHASNICFAPTDLARKSLLKEGISPSLIYVTGNTVIDALQSMVRKIPRLTESYDFPEKKMILVTAHRRENHGQPIRQICRALKQISNRSDVHIIYAVHPNPEILEPVKKILTGIPNITLLPPQGYLAFLSLMARAYLILTDSGGVQEEAPSLGIPLFVLRSVTERPEAVNAGISKLIGVNTNDIVEEVNQLLNNPAQRAMMAQVANPFGDGKASERIVEILTNQP
jgi:UDP-N-acetylglucosamine 2-epimerase (non-hydrolysing)